MINRSRLIFPLSLQIWPSRFFEISVIFWFWGYKSSEFTNHWISTNLVLIDLFLLEVCSLIYEILFAYYFVPDYYLILLSLHWRITGQVWIWSWLTYSDSSWKFNKNWQKPSMGEWDSKFFLRRNGTPPLFDVLPFEINNENYFLLIGFICTIFDNFPRSSVGWRVDQQSVGRAIESCTGFTFYLSFGTL